MPGNGDSAVITNSGTYTVRLDVSANLASLSMGGTNGIQTLTNDSQTLTVAGASSLGTNAALGLAGGNVDGAGDLTISGAFIWTGGQIIGTGKIILLSTALLLRY